MTKEAIICLCTGVLWLVAVIAGNIYYDRGKVHNDVNHRDEAITKTILLSVSMILLFLGNHYYSHYWLFGIVMTPLMVFFIYIFFFDGLEAVINLKKGWWYQGGGDGINDSWLDKQLRWIGRTGTQIFKITGILLFVFIYVFTLFIKIKS